jgi:hypothetical protein
MLPLTARPEFRRRYSRAADYLASRFAHGDVREFFPCWSDQGWLAPAKREALRPAVMTGRSAIEVNAAIPAFAGAMIDQ